MRDKQIGERYNKKIINKRSKSSNNNIKNLYRYSTDCNYERQENDLFVKECELGINPYLSENHSNFMNLLTYHRNKINWS